MALTAGIVTGTAVAVIQNKDALLDKLADAFERAAEICRQHLQENQMYAADIADGEFREKDYDRSGEARSTGVSKGYESETSSGISTPNATDDESDTAGFSEFSEISSLDDLDDFAYSDEESSHCEDSLIPAELD